MRSKHFFALLAVGMATAAMSVGCDGKQTTGSSGTSGASGSSGSGGSGATGGASGAAGSKMTTTTSGMTTSDTGDGNDTIDTAEDLPIAMEVSASLDPADTDSDFYKFDGLADAPFIIQTVAKRDNPQNDPFSPAFLDLVVTLYDEAGTQIARNDDPKPLFSNDSELYTILPKDGVYYVEIAECNKVFGSQSCSPSADIMNLDYRFSAGFLNDMVKTIAPEKAEPNDAQAEASDITGEYEESAMNPGIYFPTTVYGRFQKADDVDVFKFHLPANLDHDPATERTVAYFYVYPSTDAGNGSETSIGEMWITDDLGVIVARIDNSKGGAMDDGQQDLSPPVTVDKDYFLYVKAAAGADGTNDFYFTPQLISSSNPIEKNDLTNGLPAMAETLTAAMGDPNRYFFEGDISLDTDVDYFSAVVPDNLVDKKVLAFCGAERSGSGLRGFKMTLSNAADDKTIGMPATETATKDAAIAAADVGTATKINIKLETTMVKDVTVTSTFYRCVVVFQ